MNLLSISSIGEIDHPVRKLPTKKILCVLLLLCEDCYVPKKGSLRAMIICPRSLAVLAI